MFGKFVLIPIVFCVIAVSFNKIIRHYTFDVIVYIIDKFQLQLQEPSLKVFTKNELKLFSGVDNLKLYLSILGKVYDVSEGSTHYGPGKAYHSFVGKDTSRSFVTGQFDNESDESDKIADLNPEELRAVNHWVNFYKTKYTAVGKLIGRYYNEYGKLTPYGKEVRKLLKAAEKAKEDEDSNKLKYPPCNIEWQQDSGTHVWCSNQSGGIMRNWVGFPRQLYMPGSKSHRCACIREEDLSEKNLREYEGCETDSTSCYIKSDVA